MSSSGPCVSTTTTTWFFVKKKKKYFGHAVDYGCEVLGQTLPGPVEFTREPVAVVRAERSLQTREPFSETKIRLCGARGDAAAAYTGTGLLSTPLFIINTILRRRVSEGDRIATVRFIRRANCVTLRCRAGTPVRVLNITRENRYLFDTAIRTVYTETRRSMWTSSGLGATRRTDVRLPESLCFGRALATTAVVDNKIVSCEIVRENVFICFGTIWVLKFRSKSDHFKVNSKRQNSIIQRS